MKTITLDTIKDRKGNKKDGHKAEIVPGVKIVLFGSEDRSDYVKGENGKFVRVAKTHEYRIEFKVGDPAEYDSYNLKYLGVITSITEKTVSIKDGNTVRRLSIYEFDFRNYDFNQEIINKQNEITYNHI